MQAHIYDNTRPENLAFFQRLRSLLNEYGAVAIGEIGSDDALGVMAQYTADNDKLQMAYSFNLLTADNSAAHIRAQVEEFEAKVTGGWASWSVGNHDVNRVMTRWGGAHATPEFAKVILAMQLSLKGTPCLYQGDELALIEADLPYEVLQDPVGLTFWPEIKGRDGCRTPMPWDNAFPHAGFSAMTPWLPVPNEHQQAAVAQQLSDPKSALNFAAKIITWRKQFPQLTRGDIHFFDAPEPILALRRRLAGLPDMVAVFNLGAQQMRFEIKESQGFHAIAGHGLNGECLNGQFVLPPHGAWFGLQGA